MATVTEKFESRVYSIRGVDGAKQISTLWDVFTDAYTDDPVTVLTTPGNNGVVQGEDWPWLSFGLVAQEFGIEERFSDLHWVVRAVYAPPLVFPINTWRVKTRGRLENREISVAIDSDGNPTPIGPRKYVLDSRLAKRYDEGLTLPDIESGSFYANLTDNDGVPLTRLLRRITGEKQRRVKPITVAQPIGELTFYTRVGLVPTNVEQYTFGFLTKTNDRPFRGFDKGKVKCEYVDIDEAPGFIEGQASAGIVYDISISFSVDQNGYNPIVQYDTYIDQELGDEVFIMDSNDRPAKTEYRYGGEATFQVLLNTFAPYREVRTR